MKCAHCNKPLDGEPIRVPTGRGSDADLVCSDACGIAHHRGDDYDLLDCNGFALMRSRVEILASLCRSALAGEGPAALRLAEILSASEAEEAREIVPNRCPCCGSHEIEGRGGDFGTGCGDLAEQEVKCSACDSSWIEVYRFESRENIVNEAGR